MGEGSLLAEFLKTASWHAPLAATFDPASAGEIAFGRAGFLLE
jgi:hypothetical protein